MDGLGAVLFGLREVLVWVLPTAVALGGLVWFLYRRSKNGRQP